MGFPRSSSKMRVAVVGSSGFVGSYLFKALESESIYVTGFNSSSSPDELRDGEFDMALVAAPHAKKWWANANRDADEQLVRGVIHQIALLGAPRVILYSTIDVFPELNGVDESADCTATVEPYGRNRFILEQGIRRLCNELTVMRLPGLFGLGLKKNVLHDLLNRRFLENVSPRSTYQWYCLDHLWADTKRVLALGEGLVVLNSEPLTNRVLVRRVFPELEPFLPNFNTEERGDFVSYNVHSRFAFHWHAGDGPFMRSRDQVLQDLLRWKNLESRRE